ncbi:MAG: F0F1 ATP synthase subunit C [Thermotogae bacterium]|nr:F0F1 ATP synthase subunit C [Thermotogota bacterium]
MSDLTMAEAIREGLKFLAAGVCMGIGAIGPGLGEGHIGAHAMDAIARQPELAGPIVGRMLLADAVAESTGLYSLVVALILLFVV